MNASHAGRASTTKYRKPEKTAKKSKFQFASAVRRESTRRANKLFATLARTGSILPPRGPRAVCSRPEGAHAHKLSRKQKRAARTVPPRSGCPIVLAQSVSHAMKGRRTRASLWQWFCLLVRMQKKVFKFTENGKNAKEFAKNTFPFVEAKSIPAAGLVYETQTKSCKPCKRGTYASAGSKSCHDCTGGKYQSATGMASCTPCPKGKQCPSEKMTQPIDCARSGAEYYQDETEQTACVKCAGRTVTDEQQKCECHHVCEKLRKKEGSFVHAHTFNSVLGLMGLKDFLFFVKSTAYPKKNLALSTFGGEKHL